MFNKNNFCHIASNNRNEKKAGVFVYKTPDDLNTVLTSGYFNDKIIDINLHDLIIHVQINPADKTDVEKNVLCVTERTLDNVGTEVIESQWQGDIESLIIWLDQKINSLRTYLDNSFVFKDGSSIMTGPLNFRAGSFEGAIAGGLGDGISVYKLKEDGSIDSEVASLTKDNGFVPGATNTLNIGSSALKWKDAYIARVITAVLNNGYDIAVPVTNSADTLALKSQVDDAANSGEQLYTTGVWYAKMYAATVVPTGAEYDGHNYADFSQVDNDNNPIIQIYTGTSGAWTLTETITPPANHNGYITVTSKIWDIVEQSGQQGGQILWSWNNKTFTPYPRIISFKDAALTGTPTAPMPTNASPNNQIATKQYVDDYAGANVDLSNLTATGKNISNWSTNVSNCITEIPQDIKLELNAGVLTLKAGSKVHLANGNLDATNTITTDITYTNIYDGQYMLICLGSSLYAGAMNSCLSGTIANRPSSLLSTAGLYFATDQNVIYLTGDSGTNWYSGPNYTLPIAIITVSGGAITSIDQVFNGFGYIGSTIFALSGVKGLAPNGRNTDGTLNSFPITIDTVKTFTTGNYTYENAIMVLTDTGISIVNASSWYYYEQPNISYHGRCDFGRVSATNGSLYNFNPKTVFHATNYSDIDCVVAYMTPTSSNGYTWYRKYKSGWVEQGGRNDGSNSIGTNTLIIPMADTSYNVLITRLTPTTADDDASITIQARNLTTTSFQGRQTYSTAINNGLGTGAGYAYCWQVSGMAA